jgi:16S rRNA (guanine(966)-N(2))-methyltransferase RsmD
VREAVFSSLAAYVPGARALDLFGGSGAMGIEALSRGSERAVFVDSSAPSVAAIKRNLDKTRLSLRAEVYRDDALRRVKRLSLDGRVFDLIFIDPPYNGDLLEKSLAAIGNYGILAPGGIISAETGRNCKIMEINEFDIFKIKDYNVAKIFFMTNKPVARQGF